MVSSSSSKVWACTFVKENVVVSWLKHIQCRNGTTPAHFHARFATGTPHEDKLVTRTAMHSIGDEMLTRLFGLDSHIAYELIMSKRTQKS